MSEPIFVEMGAWCEKCSTIVLDKLLECGALQKLAPNKLAHFQRATDRVFCKNTGHEEFSILCGCRACAPKGVGL